MSLPPPLPAGGRWVDLSQRIASDYRIPESQKVSRSGLPRLPEVRTWTTARRFVDGDDLLSVTWFGMSAHAGTHVDAPRHHFEGTPSVDELPLERLAGSAVVLDLPGRAPLATITSAELDAAAPAPRPGEMVFLRTGWGAKFGREEYYTFPYLADETADWFLSRGVTAVGVDTANPDCPPAHQPPDYGSPLHRRLLGRDVLIVENLNLEHVAGRRISVFMFPIKLIGADGAPARIVAWVV